MIKIGATLNLEATILQTEHVLEVSQLPLTALIQDQGLGLIPKVAS